MMFVCFCFFFSFSKRNVLGEAGYGHFIQMLFVGLSLPSCQGEVHNESIYFSLERAGTFFCTVNEKHYRGYR